MNNYIRSLDGLRAVAVTLVMLFHFRLYNFDEFGLDVGWVGVQLFFVLSGFLITRILLLEKKESFRFYLKKFYWRRTLRIFPLYFGYLIIITIAYFIFRQPEALADQLLYLYTYTFNYTRFTNEWAHTSLTTHLWSLAVEEQFYLVWPFIVFFLSEKWLKNTTIILMILCPVIRYWLGEIVLHLELNEEAGGEAIYWFTLSHFDAFAVGGALSIFNLPAKIKNSIQIFTVTGILVSLLGVLNFMLTPNISMSSLGYPIASLQNYQHVWSYTVLNLFFASGILVLIQKNTSNFFSNKLMVSIGKVSYGMYVFHWVLLSVFHSIFGKALTSHGILAFAGYFALVYFFSYLSYNIYEKRFIALKDKYFVKQNALPKKPNIKLVSTD